MTYIAKKIHRHEATIYRYRVRLRLEPWCPWEVNGPFWQVGVKSKAYQCLFCQSTMKTTVGRMKGHVAGL